MKIGTKMEIQKIFTVIFSYVKSRREFQPKEEKHEAKEAEEV